LTTLPPEIPAVDPLEAALDAHEAELQVVVDTAFDQARRKPIQANRKTWNDACTALDRFRKERLEPSPSFDRLFGGPPEALAHLEGEWKVGKSKFYDDLKTGKLKKRDDGMIALLDLEDYARCFLSKLDGTLGGRAGISIQERKTLEEIERISVDRQIKEVRLKSDLKEWIPKSDVEIELAKRAGYLRSDLKNVFRALAGEIIKITKGDPGTIPALITWGAGQGGTVDEIMDRYSRPIKGFEEDV
jgi:hypothetical protein